MKEQEVGYTPRFELGQGVWVCSRSFNGYALIVGIKFQHSMPVYGLISPAFEGIVDFIDIELSPIRSNTMDLNIRNIGHYILTHREDMACFLEPYDKHL